MPTGLDQTARKGTVVKTSDHFKNLGGKKNPWFWVGLQVSKNTRIPTTPSLKPKGSDEHELSSVVLGNQCFVDNQKQGEIVLFKNKTEKKMFKNISAINLHD